MDAVHLQFRRGQWSSNAHAYDCEQIQGHSNPPFDHIMVLRPFGIIRSPRVLVDTGLPTGSLSGTTKSPKGLQRCYVNFDAVRNSIGIPSAHWHQKTFSAAHASLCTRQRHWRTLDGAGFVHWRVSSDSGSVGFVPGDILWICVACG